MACIPDYLLSFVAEENRFLVLPPFSHAKVNVFFFIASNALALSGVLYLSKIFQTVVFSKKIFQTVFLSIVFLGYGDNMLEFFSKLIWFVLKTSRYFFSVAHI